MTTYERNQAIESEKLKISEAERSIAEGDKEVRVMWHSIKDFNCSYEEAERVGRLIKEKKSGLELYKKQLVLANAKLQQLVINR